MHFLAPALGYLTGALFFRRDINGLTWFQRQQLFYSLPPEERVKVILGRAAVREYMAGRHENAHRIADMVSPREEREERIRQRTKEREREYERAKEQEELVRFVQLNWPPPEDNRVFYKVVEPPPPTPRRSWWRRLIQS